MMRIFSSPLDNDATDEIFSLIDKQIDINNWKKNTNNIWIDVQNFGIHTTEQQKNSTPPPSGSLHWWERKEWAREKKVNTVVSMPMIALKIPTLFHFTQSNIYNSCWRINNETTSHTFPIRYLIYYICNKVDSLLSALFFHSNAIIKVFDVNEYVNMIDVRMCGYRVCVVGIHHNHQIRKCHKWG